MKPLRALVRWTFAVTLSACSFQSLDERRRVGPADVPDAPSDSDGAAPLQMVVQPRFDAMVSDEVLVGVSVPARAGLDSVLVVDATTNSPGVAFEQGVIGMHASSTTLRGRIHRSVRLVDADIELRLSSIRGTESRTKTKLALRYPSGTEDPGFGALGTTKLRGSPDGSEILAAALQPDGKILLAGRDGEHGVVIRLDARGQRDATFGDSGVAKVAKVLSPLASARVASVAWSDRGIVVGGHSGLDGFVARLTDGGAMDTTFGSGGVVRVDDAVYGSQVRDVAVRDDGAVVFVSSRSRGWVVDSKIRALSVNGAELSSFAPFDWNGETNALAVLPGGVVAAATRRDGLTFVVTLGREGAPGTVRSTTVLDPAIGIGAHSDGTLRIGTASGVVAVVTPDDADVPFSNDTMLASTKKIAVDAQGRVVAVGRGLDDYAGLERRRADGRWDSSLVVRPTALPEWSAVVVQGDGKIVVAGYDGESRSVVATRYWP